MENNNSTAQEPSVDQPEKYRIVKIIFYFGLAASSVWGAILAALWIKFKAKQNKRTKFITVGVGLLVGLIVSYGGSFYVHVKNPELKIVEDSINQQYQDGSALAGISWSKKWESGGEAVTTNTLVVNFKSKKAISGDTMISIGRSTCSSLGAEGAKYDVIAVVNLISPIYPLSIPFFKYDFSVSNTCSNWLNNPDFEQTIKGFRL